MRSRNIAVLACIGFVGLIALALAIPVASADSEKSPRNLELEYAEAQLRLAETNLRKVQVTNERFPKTVSASVIADYGEDLAIAKAQYDGVRQGGNDDFFAGWLRRIESSLRAAEASFNSARVANQRAPGTVDAMDVERMRLRMEIARLQLERGKLLAGAPVEQQLRWQVQVLNDDVAHLKVQTSRITPQTRLYPWRY
jgi:hypothetical protein